jgi:acylphosphatase
MAQDAGIICRRVVYRGRVQGVGFRWTTSHLARSLRVSGSVRNCADGTVELLAQGPPEQVEALLEEVAAAMAGNIERADVTEEPVQADLSGFVTRH